MKFKFEKYGVGFFIYITHDDGTEETYRTSKAADGLWKIDENGNEKQISGTCQFQAYQKTEAGQKAYIRKWFRN
jgi:hypothetical protein